ncbi:cupin domain-containing protein [Actinocatenispora sera]|uniref:Cupin n=1 Tax=Actinocatenispora sera TaxID=390989 RepID=A0A810LD34_9ACTN|nr:cupin domain-containing protein [Actinocatenispora sera]BCJ31878.1 cupin [Actinocatenispora sera]
MLALAKKSFHNPDEVRTPPLTRVEVIVFGNAKAARMTLQPGWHWAEHIKPVAGTPTCQSHHVGTVLAGQLRVTHPDSGEIEIGPGDAYEILPGHDAWVVGDEPFVGLEFETTTVEEYATGGKH